mmetsp:Transcript_2312/g.4440  ORF Transcript_2312/g.4440 Transcript_2312/m.4440 type:complete len:389 (-) Transcript_2312:149-1315(-)
MALQGAVVPPLDDLLVYDISIVQALYDEGHDLKGLGTSSVVISTSNALLKADQSLALVCNGSGHGLKCPDMLEHDRRRQIGNRKEEDRDCIKLAKVVCGLERLCLLDKLLFRDFRVGSDKRADLVGGFIDRSSIVNSELLHLCSELLNSGSVRVRVRVGFTFLLLLLLLGLLLFLLLLLFLFLLLLLFFLLLFHLLFLDGSCLGRRNTCVLAVGLLLLLAVLLGLASNSGHLLDDSCAELVSIVSLGDFTTCLTVEPDSSGLLLSLNLGDSFRVAATLAQYKLLNILEEHVLKHRSLECTVNNSAIHLFFVAAHSTQLATKELGHLRGRAVKGLCDVRTVHNDSLNPVSAALNLADELGHLVAVRGVIRPVHVKHLRHGCKGFVLPRS